MCIWNAYRIHASLIKRIEPVVQQHATHFDFACQDSKVQQRGILLAVWFVPSRKLQKRNTRLVLG
jgi:hypothetical protein